jgi:hypothetical protein
LAVESEEVEAERFDLGQDAVQRGPVQAPSEHGVRAVPPRRQRQEARQEHRPKVTVYPDRVPGGSWVHAAMVRRRQVTPHHRDRVTAGPSDRVSG